MKINMIKLTVLTVISSLLLGLSSIVVANIEVKLIEPKKFRDIDVSGRSTSKSIEQVHQSLVKLLEKVMRKSDNSQLLIIEVTDIDLAGYMEYWWNNTRHDMRVVRDNDRYKIEFNYQLKNKNGDVIKQGEKKIKGFFNNSFTNLQEKNSGLMGYMKKDLEKWFKNDLMQ